MRCKLLISIILSIAIFPIDAFAVKPENTEEGKIIGDKFRSIRSEISLKVCDIFEYKNPEIRNKIKSQNRTFSNDLKADTTETDLAEKVKYCIATWPDISGDNSEKARQTIFNYLNGVQSRCSEKGKDTTWVKEIRIKIEKAVEDYSCYLDCKHKKDYTDYLDKYKKGLFVELAKKEIEQVKPQEVVSQAISPGEYTEKDSPNVQQGHSDTVKCPQCGKILSECTCEDGDNSMIVIILLLVLVILLGGGCIYYRKKSQTHKTTEKNSRSKIPIMPKQSIVTNQEISSKELSNNPKEETQTPEKTDPKILQESNDSNISYNKWIIVGASVKGNGHIQSNMTCQDNHKFESIGNGWGVAVVSDGAGSALHSELGSNVVVKRGVFHFKNLIEKEGWLKNNTLPTDMEWWQKSYDTLKTIRNEVTLVAKKNNVEVKSLSATCLVVIYSPLGLLAVHVGDGRMGYKSVTGEWKAMMTPHKGEEANQTIFLVSDFWSIPNFALSGVLVPESIVVREPVKAFTLMSDGCENTSWLCTTQNPETGKYFDQNKPFEGFFNPLEETLISFQANNVSDEEQQAKWNKFIESGTDGFVREQDDKTMIYGYCCTQQEIDDYIEKSKDPAPLN